MRRMGVSIGIAFMPDHGATLDELLASADLALAEAARRLAALGTAETLILTDVFGATPCNIARLLAEQAGVRVVAGVNVPMLWRALNYRQRPLDDMVALALAGAARSAGSSGPARPRGGDMTIKRLDHGGTCLEKGNGGGGAGGGRGREDQKRCCEAAAARNTFTLTLDGLQTRFQRPLKILLRHLLALCRLASSSPSASCILTSRRLVCRLCILK